MGDTARTDWTDALVWTLVPTVVLAAVDIGFVSGDAVKHANAFARGTWSLNPNHLLMEPVAAAWFRFTETVGLGATGPDQLKHLSILAGAVSVGLYRGTVAPMLRSSRAARNVSTAFLCSGYAFLALWISGEPIMLQMPFLVLSSLAVLHYAMRPGPSRAGAMGATFGVAGLFFISNWVVAAFVVFALLVWRGRQAGGWRPSVVEAASMGGGTLAVGSVSMLAGWRISRPSVGLLEWVTRYAGEVPTSETVYGVGGFQLDNAVKALARGVYGSAMAVVDVSPTVAAFRGEIPVGPAAVLSPIVLLLAAAVLGFLAWRYVSQQQERTPGLVAILAGWTLGVYAFGVYFNNSDDQFFFQLAVPLAMLAGTTDWHRLPARMYCVIAVMLILTWNYGYVAATQVFYPRQDRLEELATETRGAALVVYPGHDEPGRLFHLLPDSVRSTRWSLMELSARHPPESGLRKLTDSIRSVLRRGGEVRIINVIDDHPLEHPWKNLSAKGYGHGEVVRALESVGYLRVAGDSGAFSVWRVPAPDEGDGATSSRRGSASIRDGAGGDSVTFVRD